MELNSKYQIYKELVYAVVEHALGARNIVDGIEKTLIYDTFTRTEILNIACVQMESYTSDCVNLYIIELERRLESAEYQLSRFKECINHLPCQTKMMQRGASKTCKRVRDRSEAFRN